MEGQRDALLHTSLEYVPIPGGAVQILEPKLCFLTSFFLFLSFPTFIELNTTSRYEDGRRGESGWMKHTESKEGSGIV